MIPNKKATTMKAFFSAHVQRGSTVLASEAATIQRPKGRRGKTTLTSCKEGFCAHKAVLSRLLLPMRWSAQVFTDAAKSYAWLDNSADYIHRPVVHKKGEFARTDEDGLRVSSNAVEGLFSRAKRHLRRYRGLPRFAACMHSVRHNSRAPQYFMDAGLAERVREIGVGRDCGREIGVGRDCGREEMLSTPFVC